MFDEDYGVQSYFGESGDCDFFGDTSMDGGFASGMGEAGFVSEAFAQDSMGGSFFTEASELGSDEYGSFFTEGTDVPVEKSSKMSTTVLAPGNTTDGEKLIRRGKTRARRLDDEWFDTFDKTKGHVRPHLDHSSHSKQKEEAIGLRDTGYKRRNAMEDARFKGFLQRIDKGFDDSDKWTR